MDLNVKEVYNSVCWGILLTNSVQFHWKYLIGPNILHKKLTYFFWQMLSTYAPFDFPQLHFAENSTEIG